MGEEEVNDDDEQLFEPTASQDYSFEAGSSSQDYDVVGRSEDQDYSLGVADGQDFSLGTTGGSVSSQDYSLADAGSVSSQDYSLSAGGSVSTSQDYSLDSEDPSSGPLTSSFLLEDTNQNSEDGLLTSDYFGNWEEYPSEDPAQVDQVPLLQVDQIPVLQVDQVVQLRVPEAVLNIGEVAVVEEEEEKEGGDVPVPEPEADHHRDDGEHHHQGIARPDFEDPAAILLGAPPVT